MPTTIAVSGKPVWLRENSKSFLIRYAFSPFETDRLPLLNIFSQRLPEKYRFPLANLYMLIKH